MPTPKPFPLLDLNYREADANPAIQLYGRRFFSDQTIMEYLVELLLVCHSSKRIGKGGAEFKTYLPSWEQLQEWHSNAELGYLPPLRLALKLFAFLGASKLETRHSSHMQQYSIVLDRLRQAIKTDGTLEEEDILRSLENLLLGFQEAGFSRTWCAQTFFPLTPTLLMQETLWNDSVARRTSSNLNWHDVISGFTTYFSVSKHRFLARGGELIYLQICNALRSRGREFDEFSVPLDLTDEERDPRSLHRALEENLGRITGHAPAVLDRIASLIDGVDGYTAERTNRTDEPLRCGWCPEESWREGYLFAVELNRLCAAEIDPVERIDLIMLGCALHVLRSLCAQSVRYARIDKEQMACGGGLDYAWIVSDPEGTERGTRHLSQRNLQVIQRAIQQALRDEDIQENAGKHPKKSKEKLYREADKRYGHKLFVSLAKKLGFVVPQRGPGARFILSDKIIRYLVLALIRPGERQTYDDFKAGLYAHYGIALEGGELKQATMWSDLPLLHAAGTETGAWLSDMLKASGFLIHLSDHHSLVHNPFS